MVVYKIKDLDTNKYSTGGYKPNWTKRGKTWNALGHLKNHLRQFTSYTNFEGNYPNRQYFKGWWNNIPNTWVVVELSEYGIKEYSAKELYPDTTGKE